MQRTACRTCCPSIATTATGHHFCPAEVKKMLGQRTELATLKSQTLPRFDGFDEEGEAHESHFEILSIANSCPDLSLVAESNESHIAFSNGRVRSPISAQMTGDDVDRIFYKTAMAPPKLPLSFRRSTSLNSLEAEGYSRETINTVDGNVPGVLLQTGTVAKVVGQLEETLKNEHLRQYPSNDFVRSTQRASYNGSGFLHKSVSSPSVQQCFVAANALEKRGKNSTQLGESRHHHSTASQQHSSKRSFFRRKQKIKGGGSLNSGPPTASHYKQNIERMNGALHSDDGYQDALGYFALSDQSLGLQEPDSECWTMFMGPEVVSKLTDKEIKRQENMYELIMTEKHHCQILALMHYLFLGDMKRHGFRRQARMIFPCLNELLQLHFSFLRQMRERQLKFRDMEEPLDSLASLLVQQLSGETFHKMVRCYGLLFTSNPKSLEIFKTLQMKEPNFASLVAKWAKEPLLARKNLPECLLHVAQRITKYPLLIGTLMKTSKGLAGTIPPEEFEELSKAEAASRELTSRVNERVDQRHRLMEICLRIDHKSIATDGTNRIKKDDLLMVSSRRVVLEGHANVYCNRLIGGTVSTSAGSGSHSSTKLCNVIILSDSLVFTQENSNGRLSFVSPPGIVMFNNNLIIRENAGHTSSLFIMYGTAKPEMVELQFSSTSERNVWLNTVRDTISKCHENVEVDSEVEEDSPEMMEFSDLRTTRALEELTEKDKQILSLLSARSKIIDSLRTEKPHHWTSSTMDGKYDVLNAISAASNEVQRMLTHMDANNLNGVNRSASCASQHVTSGSITNLPRRADTFGGFDSQQRSSLDFGQSVNSKVLFQMVIQLADVCGEMFQQMIPNLTPNIYSHTHHQVQRRMEDLREAQQRLESEKGHWQVVFNSQREEIERQKAELAAVKASLTKEQDDISQQREQLYRKLEKLESQGMRPFLDSVSPSALVLTGENKPSSSNVSARRAPAQPPQVQQSHSTSPVGGVSGKPPKQQLPLHLATRIGANNNNVTNPGFEAPKPIPRSSSALSSGKASNVNNGSFSDALSRLSSGSQIVRNSQIVPRATPNPNNNSSQSTIQQLLPLRLSEGTSNSNKTASLPRGVGTQSVTNLSYAGAEQQTAPHNNGVQRGRSGRPTSHYLQHSKSSASILTGNVAGGDSGPQNSSYLYGSSTSDRMSNYYKDSHSDPKGQPNNGYGEYPYQFHNSTGVVGSGNPIPVVHRRSGSSPVPMTSNVMQNPFRPEEDDQDASRILFL